MSTIRLTPSLEIDSCLADKGYWHGQLPSKSIVPAAWLSLKEASALLPVDQYAKDAGRFRTLNRFMLELVDPLTAKFDEIRSTSPYRQAAIYNPELGDMSRKYQRGSHLDDNNLVLREVMASVAPSLFKLTAATSLPVNVHHVRYRAMPDRPARNSPAGFHKDGERFISVHLIDRSDILGGANHIADNDKKLLASFTLQKPGDSFLIDDNAVWHSVDDMSVAPGVSIRHSRHLTN